MYIHVYTHVYICIHITFLIVSFHVLLWGTIQLTEVTVYMNAILCNLLNKFLLVSFKVQAGHYSAWTCSYWCEQGKTSRMEVFLNVSIHTVWSDLAFAIMQKCWTWFCFVVMIHSYFNVYMNFLFGKIQFKKKHAVTTLLLSHNISVFSLSRKIS